MKIIAIDTASVKVREYEILLEQLSKDLRVSEWDLIALQGKIEKGQVSASIHIHRLVKVINDLSKLVKVEGKILQENPLVVAINIDVPNRIKDNISLFYGSENFDCYDKYVEKDDTIFGSIYSAWLLLVAIYHSLKLNSDGSRVIVFDDEAIQFHHLFIKNNKNIVLKTGDAGSWVNVYDNINDAIVDYNTIDYGWKNYGKQGQTLKVKPVFTRIFNCLNVEKFVELYGIEELIDAQEIKLPVLNLVKYLTPEWIVDNLGYALAPKEVKFEVPIDIQEKLKRIEELRNIIKEERNKIKIYVNEDKAYVVEPLNMKGMVAIFTDKEPNTYYRVIPDTYEIRNSKRNIGKKYILVKDWHYELEIEKKIKELEELEKSI